MQYVDLTINGLLLGGLYALFGLGLALIFGVMRIANIAHGELVVSGAFIAYVIVSATQMNPLVALPIVAILMFGLGWTLQSALINRVLGPEPLPPLLLTFGLSSMIQNSLAEYFGADNRGLDAGSIETANVTIGSITIGILPLAIFATAVVLFLVVNYFLFNSQFGRVIRATSEDPEIVEIMGVRRKKVFALVMGLAAALAAVAGVLLAIRSSFSPFSGAERLLIAFEVVVIGGLGAIWATFAAGILLGLVQIIGFHFDPQSGLLYGHLLLLLILLVRPDGLAGRRVTR